MSSIHPYREKEKQLNFPSFFFNKIDRPIFKQVSHTTNNSNKDTKTTYIHLDIEHKAFRRKQNEIQKKPTNIKRQSNHKRPHTQRNTYKH